MKMKQCDRCSGTGICIVGIGGCFGGAPPSITCSSCQGAGRVLDIVYRIVDLGPFSERRYRMARFNDGVQFSGPVGEILPSEYTDADDLLDALRALKKVNEAP